MKSSAMKILAVPVLLAATVTFATAQEGAKAQAREVKQDSKNAAVKTGTAIKDSWISMKVHSQFVPEDTLEGSDIDVDTNKGVVTLNGTVTAEAGKTRAAAIAKATDGVNSVVNNLKIAPAHSMTADAREAGAKAADKTKAAGRDAKDAAKEATGTTGKAITDGWIKSKIAAQYVTEDSLDNSDIDIDVARGAVVLNGAVRTAAAKDRATSLAKGTDGVKSVKNNLKIDPTVK
jgi:hyperosmotically inducible periplasmic protein